MKLTIIVPAFNEEAYLAPTLESILLWTNPVFIWLFRRRKAGWRGWYSGAVR